MYKRQGYHWRSFTPANNRKISGRFSGGLLRRRSHAPVHRGYRDSGSKDLSRNQNYFRYHGAKLHQPPSTSRSASRSEASAIAAFGCAVDGRAPDEAAALANALDEIECARAELMRRLPVAERTQVINYLDQLRAMGPNLARELWRSLHGGVASEAGVMLTALQRMIVDIEVVDVIGCQEPGLS